MLIETIRHNNADLNKWDFGRKSLLRKTEKDIYNELIKAVWHNDANLREQYLGLKYPTKKEKHYYKFTRAVRHKNANLNKWYLRSKPLLRKRYYYEINGVARHNNADLGKQCLPQNNRNDSWMLGAV